jgi:hypothetical protein
VPDDPADNHDGNTQPLPNIDPRASTEPIQADALDTESVAQAAGPIVERSSLPRWVPAALVGLAAIALALLAIVVVPQLIGSSVAPTPAPTPTLSLPSVTPTEDTEAPPAEEPPPPPPEPEPTVSVPEPTVEPTDPPLVTP